MACTSHMASPGAAQHTDHAFSENYFFLSHFPWKLKIATKKKTKTPKQNKNPKHKLQSVPLSLHFQFSWTIWEGACTVHPIIFIPPYHLPPVHFSHLLFPLGPAEPSLGSGGSRYWPRPTDPAGQREEEKGRHWTSPYSEPRPQKSSFTS